MKREIIKIGLFDVKSIFENDRHALEADLNHFDLSQAIRKFHEQLLSQSEELILRGLTPEALEVLSKIVDEEVKRRARK